MKEIESTALKFAIAAGLKPQIAYTVKETALYTGLSTTVLYDEHKNGRLKFKVVGKRNALITVKEMDRWIDEN